ncbi:MAG TPA: transglutaminase domain-containing protein [Planctomycetota bacterium]|nr:transglutaminase domain-containing protein [Planctomycetota bacterium]
MAKLARPMRAQRPMLAQRPVLAQRIGSLLLLCCTTLALANLPSRDLPLGWLLAFTLPGAVLGLLRKRAKGPWDRALLAVMLQAAACYVALKTEGPMTRPAALACTILPPLAFVTTRREESDGALGLFLSFCVLLVGIILDDLDLPLVAGYVAAASLSLGNAAYVTTRAISKPPAPAPSERLQTGDLVVSSGVVAIACLVAAFAIERVLSLLPSPSGPRSAPVTSSRESRDAPRTVGLADSFVLGGGHGVLPELRGQRLLRVRAVDGAQVPVDLYLRSGFFTVPGLDRWQLGSLDRRPAPETGSFVLRRPQPQVPVERLEVERFAAARNFVFVPPNTCEVSGIDGLIVDAQRGWLRQDEGQRQDVYEVSYQQLDGLPNGPIDPEASSRGLLALPDGFDRRPFEELLAAWRVDSQPRQAMESIAAGLRRHCRYDLAEPTGPHPHAMQNFLFATADRRGYCMHFASAAALLLRVLGIPCRIGVGLYGGEVDGEEEGARLYGSRHAHAWVEVPFRRGWMVFDPTPPVERGRLAAPAADIPADSDVASAPDADESDPLAFVGDLLTQPWLLALALLVALLWSLWPAGAPRPDRAITPPAARPARRLLGRLLRALADAGHLRMRSQTIESFARELRRLDRLLPEVDAALLAYQEVRFGGHPFDAEHEKVMLLGLEAASRLQPLMTPSTPR